MRYEFKISPKSENEFSLFVRQKRWEQEHDCEAIICVKFFLSSLYRQCLMAYNLTNRLIFFLIAIMKTTIAKEDNSLTFQISLAIYPKDVIYKACYALIDKMYIFLDISTKKDFIKVTLRGKDALTKEALEKLEGEFSNELLNCLVRENISKRNQKILEQIVGGAMGAALGAGDLEGDNDSFSKNEIFGADESRDIEDAVEALRKELEAIEAEDDYEKDALGIRNIVIDKKDTPVEKKKNISPNKTKRNVKK